MGLLSYPKTEYLLEATLESLHAESTAWLKEIEFWRDEITFFYKLLHSKKTSEVFPAKELAVVEKELVALSSEKVDQLKREVQAHEQTLASIIKTSSLQEEASYRETHRRLLMEIYDLHIRIREFKKDLFSVVEKYEK